MDVEVLLCCGGDSQSEWHGCTDTKPMEVESDTAGNEQEDSDTACSSPFLQSSRLTNGGSSLTSLLQSRGGGDDEEKPTSSPQELDGLTATPSLKAVPSFHAADCSSLPALFPETCQQEVPWAETATDAEGDTTTTANHTISSRRRSRRLQYRTTARRCLCNCSSNQHSKRPLRERNGIDPSIFRSLLKSQTNANVLWVKPSNLDNPAQLERRPSYRIVQEELWRVEHPSTDGEEVDTDDASAASSPRRRRSTDSSCCSDPPSSPISYNDNRSPFSHLSVDQGSALSQVVDDDMEELLSTQPCSDSEEAASEVAQIKAEIAEAEASYGSAATDHTCQQEEVRPQPKSGRRYVPKRRRCITPPDLADPRLREVARPAAAFRYRRPFPVDVYGLPCAVETFENSHGSCRSCGTDTELVQARGSTKLFVSPSAAFFRSLMSQIHQPTTKFDTGAEQTEGEPCAKRPCVEVASAPVRPRFLPLSSFASQGKQSSSSRINMRHQNRSTSAEDQHLEGKANLLTFTF